uniref:Thioredoxin domain-containing protein n=1 Tax=Ditylum brightwellii TaxID=49249 RepID=A0A7S4R534_9STRA
MSSPKRALQSSNRIASTPAAVSLLIVFCYIGASTSTLLSPSSLSSLFSSKNQWQSTSLFSTKKQQRDGIICGDWICRSVPRGGDSDETAAVADPPSSTGAEEEELSLDERVNAAMKKLGIGPPGEEDATPAAVEECEGGVCPLPSSTTTDDVATREDVHTIATRIAEDMGVNIQIVLAAIGATTTFENDNYDKPQYNEHAARELISAEIEAISAIAEDAEEVKELISEGHDEFLVRRALAFAEMNVGDARAILLADREDEEIEIKEREEAEKAAAEEEAARAKIRAESEMKTVTVDANFDPTALPGSGGTSDAASMGMPGILPQRQQQQQQQQNFPKEANKADVVFEATTADLQRLVMESPVPVLIDVYADWCGPCKALTPALEQMAVKAGGMFRLVKVNSDNERPVSAALEVTALPTIFAVRDGKVVNSFRGMPPDEKFMRDFMVGFLTPGGTFNPPVSNEQKHKFAELSSKLTKVACTASFSFSARERLQDRTSSRLDELVKAYGGDMGDAEGSAKVLRSLLSNVIRDPFETKFRKVNLENKVIASKVGSFPPCVAILKSVGFAMDEDGVALVLGKGKRGVNIAPLLVARDCIDKWIDQNRYKIAAAARKRKDEVERARLSAEAEAAAADADEEEEEEEEEEVDPHACVIKLRIEGKKKVHELEMHGDDPLSKIITLLPVDVEEGQSVQLTCAARRLVVKSTNDVEMSKSLRQHKLFPSAVVVVKVADSNAKAPTTSNGDTTSLAQRAAAQKSKKKGSHTMQSVGIYSKDDNAKSELIDMGGGVWYEHDITDDEGEEDENNSESNTTDEVKEKDDNETVNSKKDEDLSQDE